MSGTALARAKPWGVVHPRYAAYARTVRFHVDAARPGCPADKRPRSGAAPEGRGFESFGVFRERPLTGLFNRYEGSTPELRC